MTEISFKKGIVNTIIEVPQQLIENSKFVEQYWEPQQNIQIRMTEEQEEHFENIKNIILAIEDWKKIKLEDFGKIMETVDRLVRLGYCFTPYQRLRLYNGAPFSRLLRHAGDTEDVFSA